MRSLKTYPGFMERTGEGDLVLTIPNPHRKEIGVDLLSRILRQAGIMREKWLKER